MKKSFSSLAILVLFLACKKEETSPISQNKTIPPIAQYLNGRFNLGKIYYEGEVRSPLGTENLSAFGDSTHGYYHLYADKSMLDYSLNTYIQLSVLGQAVDIPLEVGDSISVVYDSDSSFVIEDPKLGIMRYVLGKQWADSCRLHTSYEDDTVGFILDLDLEIYLYKP